MKSTLLLQHWPARKKILIPAAAVFIALALSACGGSSGGSTSPYAQGRAWELRDYKSGDTAVAVDTQVLDAHCTSSAPAGFTSQLVKQFESGCIAGYETHFPLPPRSSPPVSQPASAPASTPAPAVTVTVTAAPPSSSAPASAPAQAQTPQQQLAAALVGGTDSTTGATVISATVGAMCSETGSATLECSGGTQVPISQWSQSGVYTQASGEVQMSDGTQDTVQIQVDNNGNITWNES
jgi:hypothetical protein